MRGPREIPGVGRYAATATLCFAYGRQLAVINSNVLRVLGRLELVETT
jgi:A/G-specific adenine glycosylase